MEPTSTAVEEFPIPVDLRSIPLRRSVASIANLPDRRHEHPRVILWRTVMLILLASIACLLFFQTVRAVKERSLILHDLTELKTEVRGIRSEYVTLHQYVKDSMALDREIRQLRQEAVELKRLARDKFGNQ